MSVESPFFPLSAASPRLDARLVGVADGRLRIVLADARLAQLVGFIETSMEEQDLLELIPDESSRTLLLLALGGVAPEVQLPTSVNGVVLVARGVVTGSARSLLLYERRAAADASLERTGYLRAGHFVGRENELATFDRFLSSDEPSILYVQGPHGIGKSALLDAFAARCVALDCPHVDVDARSSPVGERAIVEALSASTGRNPRDLAGLLASARICARKWVLFIDNFDAWIPDARTAFREVFDVLPADARIVIAGRRRPERRWWSGSPRDIVQVSLGALDERSSETLLRLHASRSESRAEILERANGHPLCLVTLAKASRRAGASSIAFDDLVDTALDSKLPPRILEVAALPARITEDVLTELLGEAPAAHDVYDLLTTICVRDPSGMGVRMPWLLRTTIAHKLRQRSPERFSALRARLAECYARRLDHCTSGQLAPLVDDVLESFAELPLQNVISGEQSVLVRRAGAGDLADVSAVVRRLGGELLASFVERRMRLGNGLVATYVAERDGRIEGLVQLLISSIDEASRAAREMNDERLSAAVDALRGLGGLTPRDPIAICAAWLTPEAATGEWGPTSKALSLLLLREMIPAMPRLFAAAFVVPGSERHPPMRLVRGVQTVRKGGCAIAVRDLRGVSPGSLLLTLLGRVEAIDAPRIAEPSPITVDAVRAALVHLGSPERLAESPLLSLRLVEAATGPGAPVAQRALTLARLLHDTIESMVRSPRDRKARDVLVAVFAGEGGKHEQIASDLGLPYGTFRRHLAHGLERVTQTLRTRDRDSFPEVHRPGAPLHEPDPEADQARAISDEQRTNSETGLRK